MPTAQYGECSSQASICRWLGASQASKAYPVKEPGITPVITGGPARSPCTTTTVPARRASTTASVWTRPLNLPQARPQRRARDRAGRRGGGRRAPAGRRAAAGRGAGLRTTVRRRERTGRRPGTIRRVRAGKNPPEEPTETPEPTRGRGDVADSAGEVHDRPGHG